MDWTSIIIAVVSSGVISSIVTHLLGRRRENVDIYETYIATVNKRIAKLEQRQYIYETRNALMSSAVSCAHKCEQPDETCPVLLFLDSHPLPHIAEESQDLG